MKYRFYITIIGFCFMTGVAISLYAQNHEGKATFNGIQYTYIVSPVDSTKSEITIKRTNISGRRIIVMDLYKDADFDTTGNHQRYLDDKYKWKTYGSDGSDTIIDSFHYRGEFEQDTLIDYFTEENKRGFIINDDGPYTFTKILAPLSSNEVKFKIRTNSSRFYFYEKFWDAKSSDTDNDWGIKGKLKKRKETVVCFPIEVKRQNDHKVLAYNPIKNTPTSP